MVSVPAAAGPPSFASQAGTCRGGLAPTTRANSLIQSAIVAGSSSTTL